MNEQELNEQFQRALDFDELIEERNSKNASKIKAKKCTPSAHIGCTVEIVSIAN